MVTWGPNTTHTFGAPAPATSGAPAPTFGAPAPTTSGMFGSAPAPAAPAFGAPAPSGGLFGSSPAPAPTTSLFGSPAPAPGGSLFGSIPAPGSSLFGTPSTTSLFGTPSSAPSAFGSTSLFGTSSTTTSAQPQQTQIPAQAALQAHMNASAMQEAERVRSALERLHAAYAGTSLQTGGDNSRFVAIVYNPLTPEQRQLQWIHGMGNGGTILEPERPPQVSDKQWKKAVVENPDPQNYMPQALVGAAALEGRIAWQQARAKDLALHAGTLRRSIETIQERSKQAQQEVEEKSRRYATLRKRLLDVMRRVELARCMNQPIQPDELNALQKLGALYKEVESVRRVLISLQDKARTQNPVAVAKNATVSDVPDPSQVLPVLKEQRLKLEKLTVIARRDQRDAALIQKRVASQDIPRV